MGKDLQIDLVFQSWWEWCVRMRGVYTVKLGMRRMEDSGYMMTIVRDGVDDSPALVAADVGIAIGAGIHIAIKAANIVIMKSNLEVVITAVGLSRKAFSCIGLNYFWVYTPELLLGFGL